MQLWLVVIAGAMHHVMPAEELIGPSINKKIHFLDAPYLRRFHNGWNAIATRHLG